MGLPMTDDELVFELSRNDVVSCRIKYADGRVNVGHGLLLEAVGLIHRERAESARLRAEVEALKSEDARLRAENERLKGALQEIADTPATPANHDLVAVIMLAQLALRDENGG